MSWKLVFVIGLCAGVLFAAVGSTSASTKSAAGSCKGAVRWDRAAALVGRVATIKRPVVGAYFASDSNGAPTFLNLGLDYPNPRRFTVLIWGRDRRKFRSPETTYRLGLPNNSYRHLNLMSPMPSAAPSAPVQPGTRTDARHRRQN